MADLFDDDDERTLGELEGDAHEALDPAALEELLTQAADAAEAGGGPTMEIGPIDMAPAQMEIGEVEFPSGKDAPAAGDALSELADPWAAGAKAAPARQVPNPSEMAPRVMDGGDQKRPFGVQDNMQDLAAAARRAGELYDSAPTQADSHAYEDRFRREFDSGGEGVERALRAAAIMKAVFGDDGGYGDRAKYLMGRQKEFAEGLAKARDTDRAKRRTSRGMAEYLALAGVSPEAVANMSEEEAARLAEVVRSTGGFGMTARGQDLKRLLGIVDPVQKTWESQSETASREREGDKNRGTQLAVADKYAQRKAGAGGGGGSTDYASLLSQQYGYPIDAAEAFIAGDPSAIPEDVRAASTASLANYKLMGGKQRMALAGKLEGNIGTEFRKPEQAARVKAMDPNTRTKYAEELVEIGLPLDSAWRGWRALSPRAKDNLVKLGMGKGATLGQFLAGDADQRAAAAVWRQISKGANAISGAAISGAEAPRLSQGFGAAMEGGQMFQSPDALDGWLRDMLGEYRAKVGIVESNFPGIFDSFGSR